MSVQYALCQKTSGSRGPPGREARSSPLLPTQPQEVMGFSPNLAIFSLYLDVLLDKVPDSLPEL